MTTIPEKKIAALLAVGQSANERSGVRFTPDAAALTARLTEALVRRLTRESAVVAEQSRKRTVQLPNMMAAIERSDVGLGFLQDVMSSVVPETNGEDGRDDGVVLVEERDVDPAELVRRAGLTVGASSSSAGEVDVVVEATQLINNDDDVASSASVGSLDSHGNGGDDGACSVASSLHDNDDDAILNTLHEGGDVDVADDGDVRHGNPIVD